MARSFRDLPRKYVLWLGGASVVWLAGIAAAALITAGLTTVQESRREQDEARRTEPRPPTELAAVPEVVIKQVASANPAQAKAELVQMVNDIRAKDQRDPDGFVKELIRTRNDLRGLPFIMGNKCRMEGGAADTFAMAVATTHDAIRAEESATMRSVDSVDQFWNNWTGDTPSAVAALTQIYGPQTKHRRESLAKHLQAVDHPASTRALARAAVFDFNNEVRIAAVDGLKSRSKGDYTEVLVAALRHPWPVAAQNAAHAIAKLQRQDLVPELVALLAEPDPRLPFERNAEGRCEVAVREMVKVNHHRNCLLCHAPPAANTMPGGVNAVVPTPGEAFPTPQPGNPYGSSPSEVMVRADVTYLRQDFSVMQPVANAFPWPAFQRFDYLVRTRVLTQEEAAEAAKAPPAAQLAPHHKAAIAALERLTGKSGIAPTAAAWAEALDMPAPVMAKR